MGNNYFKILVNLLSQKFPFLKFCTSKVGLELEKNELKREEISEDDSKQFSKKPVTYEGEETTIFSPIV